MKRKFTVVLLALAAALLLGLSIFFVACDSGTESGGQNTEQGNTDEEQDGTEQGGTGEGGGENEGETGGETGEEGGGEGETGNEKPTPVPDVSDKLVFTLNDEGTAYSVTDMDTSAAGSVTIPATYNGLPVTSIDSYAFSGCSSLMEITIPEEVTSIGSRAFYNCRNLSTINYNAVEVADLTSNSDIFYNSGSESNGITVIFGDCVKSIPAYLFSECESLVSVTIGANVENIGSYAFSSCSGLTGIAIPDSVTVIPNGAFSNCSGLSHVTIGKNVERINSAAFNNCSNLTGVYITDLAKWCEISIDPYSNSSPLRYAGNLYLNHELVTELTIPDGVENIGPSAFAYCNSLIKLTIPEGVKSIGQWAFQECGNITAINYNAESVSGLTIDSRVFENAGLDSDGIIVTFGDSVANIPDSLFSCISSGCISKIISVIIGDSVETVGRYAFYNCKNLTKVTVGSNVKSIGSNAFSSCSKLLEVYNKSALSITAGSSSYGYIASYAENVYTQEGESWFTDTAEGYRFFYDGDAGYLIEYFGEETALSLPTGFTAYDGTELTNYEIYKYAFYYRCDLISATIPESVISIGSYAFYNCNNLNSVTIGNSVANIGEYSFCDCSNLANVTIGNSVTAIGKYAFRNCSNLTEINYNAVAVSDLAYNSNVFYNAGSDSEGITVIFGENVTCIPSGLFYVSYLSYVPNLISVTIGSNIESIGSGAFSDCNNLTGVYISDLAAWCAISFIGNASNPLYYGANLYLDNELVTKLVIPEGVTSIASDAFYGCGSLTAVTIPESVTSIGSDAFYGCGSLTAVTISKGVTSIGERTFYNCSNLTSVTIGEGMTSIGSNAFYGCSSLTSVYINDLAAWCTIKFNSSYANPLVNGGDLYLTGEIVTNLALPTSMKNIRDYTFYGCGSLISVTIPDSVTSIGSGAFSNCSNLTEIIIPNSVTSISSQTFIGTALYNDETNWESGVLYIGNHLIKAETTISSAYTIKNDTLTIASYAFSDCTSLTGITIPASITSIGSYAFRNCSNLTEINYNAPVADLQSSSNIFYDAGSNSSGITVTFGESVTKIPAYLFFINSSNSSPNIVSVTIGGNVTSIGSSAFYGCSGLTELTIPASVESIGVRAFYGCSGLTELTIPASVESIGSDAFSGCSSSLTKIIVMEGNSVYHSDGNCLIETATKTLILGCQNSVIPSNGSVTSIGSSAFENCSGLIEITIPDSVTSIGSNAFSGCSGLTEITIPEGVTSIGSSAFRGCSGLTEINYNAAMVADLTSTSNVFYNAGSNSDGIMVTFGESVISIPDYLFYGNLSYVPNIVSVTIGSNVEEIGQYAFFGCSNLTELTIPASVKNIERLAFYYCSNLTDVVFENLAGWKLYIWGSSTPSISLSSSSLADPSTAAKYLTTTYRSYFWKRS